MSGIQLPSEIWNHIISYIRYDIECDQCQKKMCNKCLDGDHFICQQCNKFSCCNKGAIKRWCGIYDTCNSSCRREICMGCVMYKIITHHGRKFTINGCKMCVDSYEKRLN